MKFDVTSLYNRRAVNRAERISVGDVMERVTWSFPNKEALIGWKGAYADEENKRVTYKQGDEKANQFAHALLERGLKRGDRVLFYCANSIEYTLAQLGTIKAGLVVVPVNVMIAPDLLSYIIKSTEPKFLVVDAELYPRGEKIFKENGLETGVSIPIGGEAIEGSESFSEFISGKSKNEPEVEIHGDDIFQIMFTAGTTSLPKGVMHSHIYLYFCAIGWALSHARGVPTEIDYKHGVFYPSFHIAGQMMTHSCLMVGGTAVITRGPDPQDIVEAISEEKITTIFGNPVHLSQVCDIVLENPGKYDVSSVKVLGEGFVSLKLDYMRKYKEVFGEDLLVIGGDGQTECVTDVRAWYHMFNEKFEKNSLKYNYFGVPHPFYATTAMDENGNICPPGVTGEKVMRSPCMMAGYYNDERATREAFKFGWFHGGDAVMYDEDGLLIMVDRYKDIIKSGGENVSSARVEAVLKTHPKVEDAAVIGLPHEQWQEAVTACVITKPNEKVTEKELIEYCRERLAGYETPKKVVSVEKFPVTVGSKIQKFRLREQFQDMYKDEK